MIRNLKLYSSILNIYSEYDIYSVNYDTYTCIVLKWFIIDIWTLQIYFIGFEIGIY